MITIIERGTKEKRKCEDCGCVFSFEKENIEMDMILWVPIIKCPQCKSIIFLLRTDK